MPWHTTTDPKRYAAAAGAFLRARPVQNTVPLTVIEALLAHGAGPTDAGGPLMGWWTEDGGEHATGAFLLTAPHPLLLSAMPAAAIAALAEVLADGGHPVGGVNGSQEAAEAFAAAWTARTGAEALPFRGMRLHRLVTLVPPDPMPPGRAVTASYEQRALLVDWYEAFARDIGENPVGVARQVDDRLSYGGLTLWEHDGEPVSLAGRTRQAARTTRVAPVYTPPEHRARGYAAAVTAAVARGALDDGAHEVVLYTDLANPTSNRLYARLGFTGVEDQVVLRFTR